jgi:glycosyltransferase involved in cell wall biosynthesis
MPDPVGLNSALVTVVMVTYNSAAYVKDAIESVLSSSYTNLELIIGDDNSGDDTWNIINTYTDERIVAYKNEENLGEYPNRNKAINLAKGKYLIFIDGDDMMYPHGLEFMVKMLSAFTDCGMALMRWYKRNLFYPVVVSPHQFYTGVFFGYGFNDIAFSNVLFTTSILKEVGGLSNNYKNGDDFIRLVIGARYNTLLITDGLTWWRETSGQASSLIKNDNKHFVADYEMKRFFLNDKSSPLSHEERTMADRNLKIVVSRKIIYYIKKFKISEAFELKSSSKVSFPDLLSAFSKPLYKDPFEKYSPDKPYKLSWDRNPFTKVKE